MREAIGGTWLFGLVITFIVFFASFLAVSINYSKAFNIKNNVLDIVSKYEGNNCSARIKIGEYLKDESYLVSGICPDGYTGYKENGKKVSSGEKALYCIGNDTIDGVTIDKKYYKVAVFFKINFPLVEDLFTLNIKGETEAIYFAFDEEEKVCSQVG